jgi:endonuclease I
MRGGPFVAVFGLVACLPLLWGQDTYDPPEAYYAPAEGLMGEPLKAALHDIIDGHVVLDYYDKVPLIFRAADFDPDNPDNILLLYSGESVPANSSVWNREHTWPRSYGADAGPAFSDAHHLFAADATTNSDRSNYAFDELEVSAPLADAPESRVNDSLRLVEPRDADKGRIARALFYMDTRYDSSNVTGDFTLSDFPRSFSNRMGKLSALLKWNREFPPDERERRRNHMIYAGVRVDNSVVFQANRNPFVDHPELVDAIYTAEDFLSWGSWAVEQFSFAELSEETVSGRLADPDGDDLPNYVEFALQTDPHENGDLPLPEITRGNGINFFEFRRVPEADLSFIAYGVEVSHDPLDRDSWEAVPFTERDLQVAPDGSAEWVSLGHQPGESARPAWYRLVIGEEAPAAASEAFVIDPTLIREGGKHLFTYSEAFENGWNRSDWFGYLVTDDAPWYYHLEHKWIHAGGTDPDSVWFTDARLGWLFTSVAWYPYLYSAGLGEWLQYVPGTVSPERWFYRLDTGTYLLESSLLDD